MTREQAIQEEIKRYARDCADAAAIKALPESVSWRNTAYRHYHTRAHYHLLALYRLRGYRTRQEG